MDKPKYKRVLLKLSGETLAGSLNSGLDDNYLQVIANEIKSIHALGVQLGIVVGGGNFWRGRTSGDMNRAVADKMGILATTINALALMDAFNRVGLPNEVFSALDIKTIAEQGSPWKAIAALEAGKVVVFSGGTGNPFFSTDTGAVLRASEIEAEIVLKATNVDGVYDSDPRKNQDAKRYNELTHDEVLQKKLGVMDATAAALCRDNNLAIAVFSVADPHNITRIICGDQIGTIVKG